MSSSTISHSGAAFSVHQELLSLCNQVAPRSYISLALCFPLKESSIQVAVKHLEYSVQEIAKEQPLFAARLQLVGDSRPGIAQLIFSSNREIPFDIDSSLTSFSVSYEELRRQGFPPQYFVGPHFEVSPHIGVNLVPVALIRAVTIKGGLVLILYLHHSVSDGHSMRNFTECLAAKTWHKEASRPFTQLMQETWLCQEAPGNLLSLLPMCPEFTILADLNGPWQTRTSDQGPPLRSISRLGKIFVFERERIVKLQKLITSRMGSAQLPSTYNCIAALAFAHIVKSRMQTEDPNAYPEDSESAILWNTIGWRSRVSKALPEEYFGNAVVLNTTKVPMDQISRACDDVSTLAKLVCLIKESIDDVDNAFVERRLSLFSKLEDPRYLGFDLDPRVPMNLIFNSWRHFGADIDWNIPGINVTKPTAVRKVQGSWNLGTAILLPGGAALDSQELFVSLSEGAMNSLCMDQGWLEWVSRIVD